MLIFVHGLFGWGDDRDRTQWPKDYWYGVRKFTEQQFSARPDLQLKITTPSLPPIDSIEVRGSTLKRAIDATLAACPPGTRAHLIAHSRGGMDARWVVIQPGMAEKIASLTTIGTAHRGTTLMSWAYTFLPLFRLGGKLLQHIGNWTRRHGQDRSEFYHHFLQGYDCTDQQMEQALSPLTLKGAAEFNAALAETERTIRDRSSRPVAYMAYGGRVDRARTSFLKISHRLIQSLGAAPERRSGNDGATSVWSAHYPWDEGDQDYDKGRHYAGTIPSDHYHQVNWLTPDDRSDDVLPSDLQSLYRDLVSRVLAMHHSR